MALKKIPNDVQFLLNASARVHNFHKAIEELVYNSLDAESSSIAIRIHIQNNWLQVVDNGNGIKNTDFKLLGERFATSKLVDVNSLKSAPNKYGFKGQALANIIEVSQTVKITSRYTNISETWIKIFVEGKEKECHKVAIRPSKGTTVEINGFLFNLDIQRKSINPLNEIQDIKSYLKQILLVFNNLSISLRDDSDSEIVFKIHKNRDIYQTLKTLFQIDMKDLKELQAEKNEYKLKAFVGTKAKEFKNYQWIYLNNKHVNNSNLHKVINDKLSKSLGLTCCKTKKNKIKNTYNDNENVEYLSVPFYFLFITCPYFEYDVVYSGKQSIIEFKNWEKINMLIEKLVKLYNGDINLVQIQKNKSQIKKYTGNTRKEVKKIIEKVLGSYSKKPRVSQMQKGVKGKHVKRKKKKEQRDRDKLSLYSSKKSTMHLESNGKFKDYDDVLVRSPKNKIITKALKEKNISKNLAKSSTILCKYTRKGHENKPGIKLIKCKCNKKDYNLLNFFKNSMDTIKQRCDGMSCDVKQLFNVNICDEIKSNYQVTNICHATKEIGSKFQRLSKEAELLFNENLAKISEFDDFNNGTNSGIMNIRSYDLLQTILKTQQNSRQKDTFLRIQRDVPQRSYNHVAPQLTFQSHNYDIQEPLPEIKESRKHKFISKQSRDHFYLMSVNNKNSFDVKAGKITKKQHSIKTKNFLKNSYDASNIFLKKCEQKIMERSFLINVSKNNITECSQRLQNQITSDSNPPFDRNDRYEIHSQSKLTESHQFDTNVVHKYNNHITKYSGKESNPIRNDLYLLLQKNPSEYQSRSKFTEHHISDVLYNHTIELSEKDATQITNVNYSLSNNEIYEYQSRSKFTENHHFEESSQKELYHLTSDLNSLVNNNNQYEFQSRSKFTEDHNVNICDYDNIDQLRTYTNSPLNNYNCSEGQSRSKYSKQLNVDAYENDILEYAKNIRKQITNLNTFLDNNNSYNVSSNKSKFTEHLNLNVNIGSTFTVHVDSSYEPEQELHKRIHPETVEDYSSEVIRNTYSNASSKNQIYSKNMPVQTNVINDHYPKKKLNVLSISEPQCTAQSNEPIEPLNFCEAIFNNPFESDVEINDRCNINDKSIKSTQVKTSKDKIQKVSQITAQSFNVYLNSETKYGDVKTTENETNLTNNIVSNFDLKSRHRFVPKGLSPIFKNCFSKNICSYNFDMEYYEDAIYENFDDMVTVNSEIYIPQIQNMKELAAEPIKKATNKLKKHNADLVFGTESLTTAKVLGQVDCKFIVAKIMSKLQIISESKEYLVLFDQHAVHERIRLENNLSSYFHGDNWNKVIIDAISVKVPNDEILYLHNHKDKFTRFGLEWSVLNNCEILVNAVPEAIVGKNPRPMETIIKTVKKLISEQVHAIKYLKGNVSVYPQSLMNLVFSEACRYAIKFGDMLSKRDCIDLISSLANCKTPFQCAHGRPVMAVILELHIDRNMYKVNMEKVKRLKRSVR